MVRFKGFLLLLVFALQVGRVRFVVRVLELVVNRSVVIHAEDFHGLRQELVGIGADELLDLVRHVFLFLTSQRHAHIHIENTARLATLRAQLDAAVHS